MTDRGSPARPAAPPLVRLGAVESTQSVAFELAEQGAPDGTAVVADHQTRGRGRRGRLWRDEPGSSLLLSVVLKPRLPLARLPLLSFVGALATAEALHETAGLEAHLKWPNDVLTRGRKIAGVLLESRVGGLAGRAPVVVVGIGVNLGQTGFPPDLEGRATSVWLETGRLLDRDTLLDAVLAGLARWRRRLEDEGFGPLRERWLAQTGTIGHTVTVDGRTGVAVDLDADGALVVREGTNVRRIVAGDVRS